MLTKKRIWVAAAIFGVSVLTLFISKQLNAFSCEANSSCGFCRVINCDDEIGGGCVSGTDSHWCLCGSRIYGDHCFLD